MSDGIISPVGRNDDGIDVASLAATHLLDGAAHGSYYLDGLMILVVKEGLAGNDVLALLFFHTGYHPVEVVGNDSDAMWLACCDNTIVADGYGQQLHGNSCP
jgi:hypothetical protein